jgi:hypothetical protein
MFHMPKSWNLCSTQVAVRTAQVRFDCRAADGEDCSSGGACDWAIPHGSATRCTQVGGQTIAPLAVDQT